MLECPVTPQEGLKNWLHMSNRKDGRVGEALDLPARSRFGEGRALTSRGVA
jgi:hypothetical protein